MPRKNITTGARIAQHGGDALDMSYQRWILKQMEKRALEYSDIENINLFCCSWNVNSKTLNDPAELLHLLRPPESAHAPPPDIYAIGLQEMVDLNVMNVVWRNSPSDEMAINWTRSIAAALEIIEPATGTGAATGYNLVVERHMVGMLFLVFAKQSLREHISDLRVCLTYTGSYGTTGNKGGIAVHFQVYDSPLCFVCSHFHANRDNVATRNLDYQSIIDNCEFLRIAMVDTKTYLAAAETANAKYRPSVAPGTVSSVSAGYSSRGGEFDPSPAPVSSDVYQNSPGNRSSANMNKASIDATPSGEGDEPINVLSHEQIFWLGDLNYRIALDMEIDDIFQRVSTKTWQSLRSKDQLNQERVHHENIFHGFEEGLLSFPPTYKFQPGTDLYDNRPEKKLRAPAWCDRILWREKFKKFASVAQREAVETTAPLSAPITGEAAKDLRSSFVRQLFYNSCSKLLMSDHRPVYAQFSCDVRRVVHDRLRSVYQDLLLTVDKWINASTPKMSLDGRIIDLGTVSFENKYRSVMVAKNTGTVMAEWSFVPKNDEVMVSKPWLRISPKDGILAPEETAEIEVMVDLTDYSSVSELENTADSIINLDDIVIFRINKGSDFFCMVNAVVDSASAEEARRISRALSAPASSISKPQEEVDSDDEVIGASASRQAMLERTESAANMVDSESK